MTGPQEMTMEVALAVIETQKNQLIAYQKLVDKLEELTAALDVKVIIQGETIKLQLERIELKQECISRLERALEMLNDKFEKAMLNNMESNESVKH